MNNVDHYVGIQCTLSWTEGHITVHRQRRKDRQYVEEVLQCSELSDSINKVLITNSCLAHQCLQYPFHSLSQCPVQKGTVVLIFGYSFSENSCLHLDTKYLLGSS